MVLLAGVGSALVACGSDDDSTSAGGGAGGKGGMGGMGGKATAGASGKSSSAGSSAEAGQGGAGDSSSLYERLGGHDGIKAAIGAIVTAELADDDIASYFAPNLKDPKHVPQPGDIIECFTGLLGNAAGGPEVYPFTTDSGYKCRSMPAAHLALHIGGDTFDNFVTIAAGVLKKAKVADADIATIGSVLVGTKKSIVDADAPASGPCVSTACEVPGEAGAGGAGGMGDLGAGGASGSN